MKATGGTIYYRGQYKYHVFTSSGSFVVTEAGLFDILVIGKGGDSENVGGGGGAGGYNRATKSLATGTYTVGMSDFIGTGVSIVSDTGGIGKNDGVGGNGASGGGGTRTGGVGNIGTGNKPEGNDGGDGDGVGYSRGGGGGCISKGSNSVTDWGHGLGTGGNGGDGIGDDILAALSLGTCCGGGRGYGNHAYGVSGLGGGSSYYGGGANSSTTGQTGGPAIVVVRYVAISSVVIIPSKISIKQGIKYQYIANAIYNDGNNVDVSSLGSWSSGDTSIATIDSSGLLSTISFGETTINFTYLTFLPTATINITSLAFFYYPNQSVSDMEERVRINLNDTVLQ